MKALLICVLCFIMWASTTVLASKYGYINVTTPITHQTAELIMHDLNDVAADLTVAMTTDSKDCKVEVSAVCVPKPIAPFCGDGIVNQEWERCDGWAWQWWICRWCQLIDMREPVKEIPVEAKPIVRPSKPVYMLPPTWPSNGTWRAIPMSELLKLKLKHD